jgi:hypothetical protein
MSNRQPRQQRPAAGHVPTSPEDPLWVEGPAVPLYGGADFAPAQTHAEPAPRKRFEGPSDEDRAWAAAASARGSFKPPATRPVDVRKTGRWGTAVRNYSESLKRKGQSGGQC